MTLARIKTRLHEILEVGRPGDRLSTAFDIFLIVLIIINVLAVVLESIGSWYSAYRMTFVTIELVSVSIFTLEYILRVWTITCNEKYKSPVSGRLRYMKTPMALIDLLAIIPFYLTMLGIDLRVIRIFRLFRIFLLAKLVRYSSALRMLFDVMRIKSAEIGIMILMMIFILIVASSLVYFAEYEAQPEKFSSIPASMWWGIATLTTVGYGDIAPVTALGKFFAAIIAIAGIGMFALPAGIIGSAYIDAMSRQNQKEVADTECECPHCGRTFKR